MKFVPFGDSHSVFWGMQQSFDAPYSNVADTPHLYWIGPAKVYGLENPTNNHTREKYLNFKNLMIADPDAIPISCFGEIDIRVNIAKIVLEDRNFISISQLADLYLRKINELPNQHIIIWGPPPASMLNDGSLSQDYPFYGSGVSRNSIIHLFNLAILRKINEYPRIRFITLFYDLVDSSLNTNPLALHDVNHLDIIHFPKARELLHAVLNQNTKAAFDFKKMQSIGDINFSLQSVERDILSYFTNMLFSGPIEFSYFSNLNFHNPNYRQSEIILKPGKAQPIPNPVQIGNHAFLELYFQGNSEHEFLDFANFCKSFNGSDIDIFDTKDAWLEVFRSSLKRHEKTMLRRYLSSKGGLKIPSIN